MAKSSTKELTEGKFVPFYPSEEAEKKPFRLLLCSGQVYWAIKKRIQQLGDKAKGIAVARVEQISPFPYAQVKAEIERFSPALKEVVWVQEEAMNVGAYFYVKPRIEKCLNGLTLSYAGRKPYAGIATGFKKQHLAEEEAFLNQALNVEALMKQK
jgi:2-oxoglutarate dehydrogenase E1 component